MGKFQVIDGGKPSIPRPEGMFDPSEDSRKPLRDKLLFTEAMMASDELTGRELRVGFLLVSMCASTLGFSYPSMQYIADALGLDKRNVGKALKGLEAKGWFLVDHGTRGRGAKNHANRYAPNAEKVSSATPFKDAAVSAEQRRAEQEKVSERSLKGVKTSLKGVTGDTQSDASLSGVLRTETFRASHGATADAAARDDLANAVSKVDCGLADPVKAMRRLKQIERDWLRYLRAQPDQPLTAQDRRIIGQAIQDCDLIAEIYDSHTGHPVGGMAHRLAEELSCYLPQDEANEPQPSPAPEPEPEPEESFEEAKARVIRELEASTHQQEIQR